MKGSLCSKVLVLFFVCVSLVFIVSCSGGVSGINSGTEYGMNFDLTDAKSFFAGKASSISANRAVRESDNNSEILLKINNKGEIEPAVTLKDNVSFDLKKIFKNPVKRELILTGRFSKWVSDPNWSYSILRVSEDGIWYGLNLENYQFFDYISEPFDMNGNFYF